MWPFTKNSCGFWKIFMRDAHCHCKRLFCWKFLTIVPQRHLALGHRSKPLLELRPLTQIREAELTFYDCWSVKFCIRPITRLVLHISNQATGIHNIKWQLFWLCGLLQVTYHFRLNTLQGYQEQHSLALRKKLNEQPKIEIHWIFCIFLVFALGCFSVCYEEQVLDYWSKIVLDQREFREKLLKAGNRTLFLCGRHRFWARSEKWLAKGLHESETWTLQSVGIISEKLLRRSHWPSGVPSDCLVSAAN